MKSRWLVVISFTLMPDLLGSAIPPSCVRDARVLVCRELNFSLRQIYSTVAYDFVIDFVFINNTRLTCTCKVINLARMLRVTDVIIVTMRPCTVNSLKACKVDPVVSSPQLVAGLVVSREDCRRNWAIKHHVDNLWDKIANLEQAELRSFLFDSIIKAVEEELERLKTPETAFSRAYAAFVADRWIVATGASNLRDTTTQPLLQNMLQKWKSMESELDTTQQSTTSTTAATTTTTVSFDELQWRMKMFRATIKKYYRSRMMKQQSRRRGKRDILIIRTRKHLGLNKSSEIQDSKINQRLSGSLPIWMNQPSSFTADMLIRIKRQASFASVVPYLAFAGGEYYSLYDPGAIMLALPRNAQPSPLTKKSKAPKRNYPVDKPVAGEDPRRRSMNTLPVVATTGKGPQLSPADISRMTRESDHRVKSFIIFFVALTGVITVITVLLVMAMKRSGDSQEEMRQNEDRCDYCGEFILERGHLLVEPTDTKPRQCQLSHRTEHPQTNTLPKCLETDKNVNRQPENNTNSATYQESIVKEKDGIITANQLDVEEFGSLRQYQPCLHAELLTPGGRGAISRPARTNEISVVKTGSSRDLLQLETKVAVSNSTNNNSNTININTNNNNNDMAIKVKGHQAGDCHTKRVLYSRHGIRSVWELYVTSRLFDPKSGYTLSDFLNLYIARCELRDSSQQYNLTRNQDIGVVAQTHRGNRDVTESQNIINRLASDADDTPQCLHDCQSNTCNRLGNRSLQSTEHSSRVSQSTANTITSRRNSCRNNTTSHEQLTTPESKKSELSPNRSSSNSYSRQCGDLSLDTAQVNPRRIKCQFPDKPNIGGSSSHGMVSTLLSEIKSSSPTGDTKQRAAKNDCRCSGQTASAVSTHNMPWNNESGASGHGLENRANASDGDNSLATSWERRRSVVKASPSAASVGSSVTSEPGLPVVIEVQEAADQGEHADEMRRKPSAVRSPTTQASARRSGSARSGSAKQRDKKTKTRYRKQGSYKRRKTIDVKAHPSAASTRGSVSGVKVAHLAGSDSNSTSGSRSSPYGSSSASEQSVTSTDKEADQQGHRDRTDNRRRKSSAASIRSSVSDQSNSAKKKSGKKKDKKPKSAGKKANVAKRGKAPGKAKKKPHKKRKKKRRWSAGKAAGLYQIVPTEDTDSRPSSGEDSDAQRNYPPDSIAGVITDDHFVIRRLQSRNELPFNRYTSLSLIFNAPEIAGDTPVQDKLMVVRKTDINPMQTTMLQPLHHSIPYYMSVAKKKRIVTKAEKVDPNAILPRIPPVALADVYHEQGIGRRSQLPAAADIYVPGQKWSPRHVGVEWPVKYASKPPYSTPSYNGPGVKQPVGVVPVEKVPWQPEYGIVGNHYRIRIPTWVSPLYKPYGIGGHITPEAPVTDCDIFTQQGLKKKQDSRFCQWLKNLFKPSKSKEHPRSTTMPRRSSIFTLRRKSQQMNKTADIPSDSYIASTAPPVKQSGDKLPAAGTQEPELRQSVEKLPDEQAGAERFSFTQRPSVTEQTVEGDRPSFSEDAGKIKRPSVTEDADEAGRGSVSEDAGEAGRGSVSEDSRENKRPSVTESERGSVSEESRGNKRPNLTESERGSVSEESRGNKRSSITDSERGSVSEESRGNKRLSITDSERGSVSEESRGNKRPSITDSERGSVSEESRGNKRPSITDSERGSVSENLVDTKRGSVSKRPSA